MINLCLIILLIKSRDSSVGIALGCGLDDWDSRALGPTQPPIQWAPGGALSLGLKRPGRVADHSSPSIAEVKELVELYLHSANTPSWCGAYLKHRDKFTFSFIFTLLTFLCKGTLSNNRALNY
jgi:hypothetical protein